MKKTIIYKYITIIITSIIFVSCSNNTEPVNVICLVDFSSSVNKATLKWYGTVIKEDVISSLGKNDKLTILPIDFGSQSGSKEIFYVDLEKKKFTNMFDSPTRKDEIESRRIKAFLEKLAGSFDSSFESSINTRDEYKHQTDIIGAVRQADKYYMEGSNNLIVIFSDMVQETENLDLPTVLKTSKDFSQIVEKIDLGKLRKSDVMVITGEQSYGTESFNKMKTFWKLVFDKAGLKLLDYESAGRNFIPRQLELYRTKTD